LGLTSAFQRLTCEGDRIRHFTDFPFLPTVFTDIETAGFETPTPIQAKFIPPALEGRDVIGLAQTGTGKTAAFALPIIHRIAQKVEMAALVLSPTRELARQITSMFNELGESSGIRVATIVGGIDMITDYKALQSWPNVLVATPGRLIDHLGQGTVSLDDIEVFVVDEADRMHDMGFIPQIRTIIEKLPQDYQTLMLTATMPEDVEEIARKHMKDALRIQVGRRSAPAERAEQRLYLLEDDEKTGFLVDLLRDSDGQAIVFLRTKVGVNRLARVLRARKLNVVHLHSGRMQSERDDAMAGFREGRYRILVATDIAARGLDVANIDYVYNYDFPLVAEDYVHRIGRTARVAAKGFAVSFVTRDDIRSLKAVERLVGDDLPLLDRDGTECERPKPRGGGRHPSGRSGGRSRGRSRNARGKRPARKRSRK
jgi:ATP-dependent RNA helicase RhlE